MHLTFHGAVGEVTGSCYLLEANGRRVLFDCGLFQGNRQDEQRNQDPFPFDPPSIDAVVLSHAHIDHSGRLPLLVKRGFSGPIYTQRASRDLCRIMLRDAAYINERDAWHQSRKRARRGRKPVEPLYTLPDVEQTLRAFVGIAYDAAQDIVPGVRVRLRDAGHILGSSIVEVWVGEGGVERKLVFSGDLGHRNAPILRDPTHIRRADMVVMESTYGNREHRTWPETRDELGAIFALASREGGNILVPSFAVGRSQELLYLLGKHFKEWDIGRWHIFLDSPMAIRATTVYMNHSGLYDKEAASLWRAHHEHSLLPNLHLTRTPEQSMRINDIRSGALIIAGSGMCTGGRIRHHFKHNIWNKHCHVLIVGYQAAGTLGRTLVDGAREVRLWGEPIHVGAKVHTIGGLSSHADCVGLQTWYAHFQDKPSLVLTHGENEARQTLADALADSGAHVALPGAGATIDLMSAGPGRELRYISAARR